MSNQLQPILEEIRDLFTSLEDVGDKRDVLRLLRETIHELSPTKDHPVDYVRWVPIEKVCPNDYNPNSVARIEMSLLLKSIENDGYCIEASTPILKANLMWAPADSLVAGDAIIAFDEDRSKSKPHCRRYRPATVVSNSVEPSDLLLVSTDRGVIKVTEDHPFLTRLAHKRGPRFVEWVRADKLSTGDQVVYLMDPWLTEEDRVAEYGDSFFSWIGAESPIIDSSVAIVESVKPVGSGNIARLSTSTSTYIANGFAVHNTQPVVTIYDPDKDKYVIVDGFHRYTVMATTASLRETTGGLLPIVVINKTLAERMASTIRHNRARGKHSVEGMASLVFKMLEEGRTDAEVCNDLGMEPEELLRLKHVTGFSRLFENTEYRKAWESRSQIRVRKRYLESLRHTEEGAKTVDPVAAEPAVPIVD